MIVPEGGGGELGRLGCEHIIEHVLHRCDQPPSHIVTAVGTGTTAKGLLQVLAKHSPATQLVCVPVIKGAVDPKSPKAKYQMDGLSGATLTSRGVENMLHYWLSDQGFGPYLNKIRAGGN